MSTMGFIARQCFDSYLRFMYFGIVAPGSTNDVIAYSRTGDLQRAIENLEFGDFVVGDAAYTVTEHLLIPFTGSQRDDEKQDAFNFYLSQLRIRIEMAFGLLVKKFSILKKPLQHRLKNVSQIIMCCAQLHNFVINNDGVNIEDGENGEFIDTNNLRSVNGDTLIHDKNSPGGQMVYQPTMEMTKETFREIQGVSNLRRTLVRVLDEANLKRPQHNLLRNSRLRQLTPQELYGGNENYKNVEIADEYYHPS